MVQGIFVLGHCLSNSVLLDEKLASGLTESMLFVHATVDATLGIGSCAVDGLLAWSMHNASLLFWFYFIHRGY